MTDKQIIKAVENMLRLNDICVTCVSEIEECDCRKVAEDLCLKLSRKEQECEELKDKLSCCFCNPNVPLNDFDKQRKCVEVTECFRRQLDQLKAENEMLLKDNKALCERIAKLEEEVEKQRTVTREYEMRWLTSMGYYGVK